LSINQKLAGIIEKEKITIVQEAIDSIIKISKGDMRKVLNILESCALSHRNDINPTVVY